MAATVGVGIFGIPLAFAKAGFGVGFLFLIGIAAVLIITNLLYGEVVLRTHNRHQFIGYVHAYLGPIARKVAVLNFWIAVFGSVLGILIINGQFASDFIRLVIGISIRSEILSTIFFVLLIILALRGLRTVARIDSWILIAFTVIIGGIVTIGMPQITLSNFTFFNDPHYWYLPFGVLLFSLNGIQGIPLVREMLVGRETFVRRALIVGTLIPAVFYALFAFTVVGITGDTTTPTALSGLETMLGSGIIIVGTLFGFLSSTTIFLSMAIAFRESLIQDFHIHSRTVFITLMLIPYLLFILGVRDFVSVIGLVGGIAVSIDTVMLIMMYLRAKKIGTRAPEYTMRLSPTWLYVIGICFILGSGYTFFIH